MADKKPSTREEMIRQDMQDLHKLGYAQQLFREMGGFSNFAISFSIISILTGAILLYGYGLGFAGPIINTYGWPLVSFFVICIAASMAELASAYPTAGGLYFWAHRLGGYRWAWITAWFNMLGQIMITAGIDFAAAIYIAGAFNRIFNTEFDTTNSMTMVIVMVIIMIPQMIINIFGIKLTARLSDFSVWWHIGGVMIMVGLLLLFGKYKNEFGFLFQGQQTVNPNDIAYSFAAGPFTFDSLMMQIPGMTQLYAAGGLMLAFTLGLLQAQWTYTGYDASAHVAEETVMARLNSAWGVFLSVAVSFVVGYVMLLTLTLAIPNGLDGIAAVIDPANSPAVLYIVYQNFDNQLFSNLVAVIIGGAMWLSGPGSDGARAQFAQTDTRRREFRSLVLSTRGALQEIYASSAEVDADRLRQKKALAMQEFRDRYAALKQGWGGYSGYDSWVAGANNANLGAQAAYDELVPQFEVLFSRQGRDWHAFYDVARRIADLPSAERRRALAVAGE